MGVLLCFLQQTNDVPRSCLHRITESDALMNQNCICRTRLVHADGDAGQSPPGRHSLSCTGDTDA